MIPTEPDQSNRTDPDSRWSLQAETVLAIRWNVHYDPHRTNGTVCKRNRAPMAPATMVSA